MIAMIDSIKMNFNKLFNYLIDIYKDIIFNKKMDKKME